MTPKIVRNVSDPPVLTADDVARIGRESDAIQSEFLKRTAPMENITAEDLATKIK